MPSKSKRFFKNKVTIEHAKTQDVEKIYEILKNTWTATYPNQEFGITHADIEHKFRIEQKSLMDRIEKDLASSTEHIFIAKVFDEIVGFCLVSRGFNFIYRTDFNFIHELYILPDFQGLGIGKMLMGAGINWCDELKPIYLTVVSYNYKAIRFYRAFGFKPANEEILAEKAFLPSGKSMPEILMKRPKKVELWIAARR